MITDPSPTSSTILVGRGGGGSSCAGGCCSIDGGSSGGSSGGGDGGGIASITGNCRRNSSKTKVISRTKLIMHILEFSIFQNTFYKN